MSKANKNNGAQFSQDAKGLSFDDFSQTVSKGSKNLGIAKLPQESIKNLYTYFLELKKWSRKINLISAAPDLQIIENHLLDSLSLVPLIKSSVNSLPSENLIDIGSGAGLPGLILKIAEPNLNVTLLEPRLKRVSFLKHIIRTINLENTCAVSHHLERHDPQFVKDHGKFSLITCRALTELSNFLAMTEQICLPGGIVICMKGPRIKDELENWQSEYPDSSFTKIKDQSFSLPFSKAERALVVFQKTM